MSDRDQRGDLPHTPLILTSEVDRLRSTLEHPHRYIRVYGVNGNRFRVRQLVGYNLVRDTAFQSWHSVPRIIHFMVVTSVTIEGVFFPFVIKSLAPGLSVRSVAQGGFLLVSP